MAHPGNGDPRYEVYCSGLIAKSIRDVHRQAVKEGRGQAMVDAFRLAVRQLRQNPTRFGDPLYRLPALRMQVYTAVVQPIALHYAVCTDRPLVFIKAILLLSE
jgi:hypothetical protein